MLGFFLGLKCLSDGAQICCWSLSAQDCRVSGPINDLKNVDQFYLSDSAPHPSNKNTVANRNLLSSIIRILTFIPLWRSQLEMISDFFFPFFQHYLSNPATHGETLARGILHWAPLVNFAVLTDTFWLWPDKNVCSTCVWQEWVSIVTVPRKSKQSVNYFSL